MKDALIVYKPVDIGEGRTLTLAAEVLVSSKTDFKSVRFGMSLKNPTDKESTQQLGDTIAKGRAQKNATFMLVSSGETISRAFVDKIAAVLTEEIGSKVRNYVPFSDKKKTVSKSKPRETEVVSGGL